MKYQQKGFALLYAILLTGAILSVGVILMNIITKQLLFSSINRNSEISYYYAANSGRECLYYYAVENPSTFYRKKIKAGVKYLEFKDSVPIKCFNSSENDVILTKNPSIDGIVSYGLQAAVNLDNQVSTNVDLQVSFNEACILEPNSGCSGETLENKNMVVIKAFGSSGGSENRNSRRVAIAVQSR